MGLGISNKEDYVELSIPIHEDISSLVFHLRKLADKLEQVQNQDFPKGKVCKMTPTEKIEEISLQMCKGYYFMSISLKKEWNFTLDDWDKVLGTKVEWGRQYCGGNKVEE